MVYTGGAMANPIAWYEAHADDETRRYAVIGDVKTLDDIVKKERAEVMRPQSAEK